MFSHQERNNTAAASNEVNAAETRLLDTKVTNAKLFRQLLQFIYTDSCELLTPNYVVVGSDMCLTVERKVRVENTSKPNSSVEVIAGQSAHEVFTNHSKKLSKQKQKHEKEEKLESVKLVKQTLNAVESLKEFAKKFGVKSLWQRLDCVKLKGQFTYSFCYEILSESIFYPVLCFQVVK